jgi:HAMP domain-containing protein
MSASLYELAANYMAALDFLTDPNHEVDQQTLIDTMEALDGELDDKLINVGKFVISIESQAEGIKAAEKRMEARRKALENKAEWLRDYMKRSMESTGKAKLSAPDIALSLAKKPPSVVIDDESMIPPEFFEPQQPKLSKEAIKQAGGCPGAHIESTGYRVSIK